MQITPFNELVVESLVASQGPVPISRPMTIATVSVATPLDSERRRATSTKRIKLQPSLSPLSASIGSIFNRFKYFGRLRLF